MTSSPKRYHRLKRLIDVGVAGSALAVGAPLLGSLTAVQVLIHGWPPVFVQKRPGLHGKPFAMMKFRTMTNEKGPDGKLLPDEERLTRFGKLLRQTSLDELPGLINVLKGDMSLVGPRPLLMEYLPRYSKEQMKRHNVRPGITGWAQVNGRNAISWEEKFRLDLEYIQEESLMLDIEILVKTVKKVLIRDGIAAEGSATMPIFMGNAEKPETSPPTSVEYPRK